MTKSSFTCTSWSWSLLPFEKVVKIMNILGFRHIDVGAFTGWAHFDADDLARDPQGMAARVRGAVERYEMTFTDLFVTFGRDLVERCVNHPDASSRHANVETFKGITDFCALTRIPGVTLCPGVEHASLGRNDSFDLAVEGLTPLVAVGRDAGLRVSIEPHVESIVESPEETLRLLTQVDNLLLTLDYAHFIAQGYAQDQVDPLLIHAAHFHARQARRGENQCRTREGEIDFARIMSLLEKKAYAGYVALEYVWEQWQNNDRVDVLSETVLLSRILKECIGVRSESE